VATDQLRKQKERRPWGRLSSLLSALVTDRCDVDRPHPRTSFRGPTSGDSDRSEVVIASFQTDVRFQFRFAFPKGGTLRSNNAVKKCGFPSATTPRSERGARSDKPARTQATRPARSRRRLAL